MTNLEGRGVYGDSLKDLDVTHLQAYIGLLIAVAQKAKQQQSF